MHKIFLICLLLTCSIYNAFCSYVRITTNAPAVVGSTVNFAAVLHNYNPLVFSSGLEFSWKDNAIPTHTREFKPPTVSSTDFDEWNVTYSLPDYPPGEYIMEVVVTAKTLWLLPQTIASDRIWFNVTESLNGNITNTQNNKTIQNSLAMTSTPIEHVVRLKDTDLNLLNANATQVVTYWFVDCVYYGPSSNYSLLMNYTEPDKQHTIEALVIAGYEPLTTPAPSTTTTTTTTPSPNVTTTTTAKTTTTATSTTVAPPTTSTATTVAPKNVTKREAGKPRNGGSAIKVRGGNGTLVPYEGDDFPFVCVNNTIPPDPTKTYGYFSSSVTVKAAVSKVQVTGDNWLLHGDILNLSVKCQGTPMFSYCVNYYKGQYNVTGNETCENPLQNQICEFHIERYFQDSMDHTIVFIISNDVSKIVYPVMVQVYKVQKQAQLSVIIVPVTFTLIAVVLIIFGVAYYVQNRNRFTVEVADFNFGQTYSDMEYMTFRERLRDSIVNAFTRAPTPSSSEGAVWPPGNNKYGSMT